MSFDEPARDVQAFVAGLFVYPIKSCAGVSLDQALLLETGLELDRAWMVVNEAGQFVSQRELPRMALIRVQLKTQEMLLRAPGMLTLHVSLDAVEQPTRVRVWRDEVAAFDMGATAAQWFSDFLGQRLRLVRFDPAQPRLSDPRWTGALQGQTQFADGFSVLVLSQASLDELNRRLVSNGHLPVGMERFRPNVVLSGLTANDEDRLDVLHIATEQGAVQLQLVKPCPRCPIPNIDPATALSSPEVGDTLQGYRAHPLMDGAITFGMNAIVLDGVEQLLRVGQAVAADYRF